MKGPQESPSKEETEPQTVTAEGLRGSKGVVEDWGWEKRILSRNSGWRENSINYRPVNLSSRPGKVVKWPIYE